MAILTYHHIAECPTGHEDHRGLWVSPELFREQIKWLHDHHYETITLDRLIDWLRPDGTAALPKKWVIITFDDGFRDNLTNAWPILQEFGFTAIIFVITSRIRPTQAAPSGEAEEYLSADEIREMHSRGIQFGSHSETHPRLAKLSDDAASAELVASREKLAAVVGAPVNFLAYPYGSFSRQTGQIAQQCGYRGALATIRDNQIRSEQIFWMPRVMVMHDTTPARLRYMLSWRYHLIHSLKNRRRWATLRKPAR